MENATCIPSVRVSGCTLFLALAPTTHLAAAPIQPGHDWSLPDSIRETPNAGWAWCNPEFARDWQKRGEIESQS